MSKAKIAMSPTFCFNFYIKRRLCYIVNESWWGGGTEEALKTTE